MSDLRGVLPVLEETRMHINIIPPRGYGARKIFVSAERVQLRWQSDVIAASDSRRGGSLVCLGMRKDFFDGPSSGPLRSEGRREFWRRGTAARGCADCCADF